MYTQTGDQTAGGGVKIFIGAQLGAQFIKILAGCSKMTYTTYKHHVFLFSFYFHVSATEIFNPSSKNIRGQHHNRCYSVFILMLDFAP